MTLSDRVTSEEPSLAGVIGNHLPRRTRKVFYLVDSLNVGGTETQAVELALRIPAAGYEVTLGCLAARGPLLAKLHGSGVRIEEFHPSGGIDSPAGFYQLLRLSWFLRREKFDVVHTHDLWSNLMGVPAAWLAGVPAIISSRRDLAHLDWYQGPRRKWLRRIQNLSQVVLANATPIRDALIADDGFVPAKLRVIHNGVDLQKFQMARTDRERLFPGSGQWKMVALVGNMNSDIKGHPWAIDGALRVVQEFPEVRFIFVGDGNQRSAFEKQVAQLRLERNFIFLGRRNDIAEILSCCDIAMLPSRAEGMPNAVLEYMAAGLPVIVSHAGGNAELIEDGVTGLLIPAKDSAALSIALLRFLKNPTEARQMAEKGRTFAIENFSFDRLVREVDALYSELLDRRRGTH